jgi:hypothetical protein
MDKLFRDAIEATRPRFATPKVSVPFTASSLRTWDEKSSSVWLVCGLNEDGSYNIVYDVGHAQN